MRTGFEQTNQISVIGATDATVGGRLVLGYGGNTSPAIGGASQWRLISNGSTFQLVRVNSGNTGLITQQVTEDGSFLFQGTAGRFSFDLSGANTVCELRNINGGLIVIDITRDGSTDFDYRWIQNSLTDFLFTGRATTAYRSDRPWNFQDAVAIGSTGAAGTRSLLFQNSAGSVTLETTPTGSNTAIIPAFNGTLLARSTGGTASTPSLALPSTDGTTGGRLVLGYGGNDTATVNGASQWRLNVDTSTLQFVRSNSSSTLLTALSIAESGAATFNGNPTIGPAGSSGLRDLVFASTSGNLTLRSNHSENKTYSFPDFVGVSSGTLALLEVPQPIITSSSTGVTLNVAGGFFRLTNATGGANEVTLTVPNNASVPMPIGAVISFVATNGWANLALGGGVSLINRTPFPLFFIPRGVTFEIQKVATDEWELTCRAWNPSQVLVVNEEILTTNSGNSFAIDNAAGTTTSTIGTSSNPGNIQLSTSTSATGRSAFVTHLSSFVSAAAGGRIYLAIDGVAVTANSDATQTFISRVGFFDGLVATDPAEGAYFQHSTANSGNWEYVIRDASATTSLASSTPATTAANLAVLMKPGAAHTFAINGVTQSLGSTQVVSLVRAGGLIVKTLGTTARGLILRRLLLIQELY